MILLALVEAEQLRASMAALDLRTVTVIKADAARAVVDAPEDASPATGRFLPQSFDRVLLDAPCTGLGSWMSWLEGHVARARACVCVWSCVGVVVGLAVRWLLLALLSFASRGSLHIHAQASAREPSTSCSRTNWRLLLPISANCSVRLYGSCCARLCSVGGCFGMCVCVCVCVRIAVGERVVPPMRGL